MIFNKNNKILEPENREHKKIIKSLEQEIDRLKSQSVQNVTKEATVKYSTEDSIHNIWFAKEREMEENMKKLIANSDTIEKDNRHTTYELFATLAKLDHILFKVNAYNGVFNNKSIELSDHHNCRFGK